ncbi:hypothetical protein VWY03_05000 [Phaeobacter sp. JH20_09]|uniref:hypothetical protein n=1 Tax=unclassified Phaeobacter TaxID=2621772 RepID=UPI003A8704BA
MEEINAEWLKSHLDGSRGEQSRLSRETGISPDKITKILKGRRQVQAAEAPLIYRFFYPEGDQDQAGEPKQLLEVWYQLGPEERDFLLKSAIGLLSPHLPRTREPDE